MRRAACREVILILLVELGFERGSWLSMMSCGIRRPDLLKSRGTLKVRMYAAAFALLWRGPKILISANKGMVQMDDGAVQSGFHDWLDWIPGCV